MGMGGWSEYRADSGTWWSLDEKVKFIEDIC